MITVVRCVGCGLEGNFDVDCGYIEHGFYRVIDATSKLHPKQVPVCLDCYDEIMSHVKAIEDIVKIHICDIKF